MNVGRECERQVTEGDGHGRVPCRWPRCVTKSKMLIGYVGREHPCTDDKGGQPPKGSHLIRRSRPGECGGCDTNGDVEHADEYRFAEPSLAVRVLHACGLHCLDCRFATIKGGCGEGYACPPGCRSNASGESSGVRVAGLFRASLR